MGLGWRKQAEAAGTDLGVTRALVKECEDCEEQRAEVREPRAPSVRGEFQQGEGGRARK